MFSILNILCISQTNDNVLVADSSLITKYSSYKFKFGGGCGFGGAFVKPLGNFSEIRNDYGSGNVLILFSYGRIIYYIDIVLGNSKAHGTFQNSDLVIIEDSIVAVSSFENSLGYLVLDRRRVLAYPWVGISTTTVMQNNGIVNNEGPYRTTGIAGLTLGYRFGDVFSKSMIGSFEVRSRIAYTKLEYYDNLDVSNLRIGISFIFHIRGAEKRIEKNK